MAKASARTSKLVSSTEDFIREVFCISTLKGETLFYRGHSDANYGLHPHLLREARLEQQESTLFNELLSLKPDVFARDGTAFEKLVRMQHYSLPTRLLDITSNPLIALFFACNEDAKKSCDGDVVVFTVRSSAIKFFDSDTVSLIANLVKLTASEKSMFDLSLALKKFNRREPAGRFLHFIKQEKPYFLPLMDPRDLNKVVCVRGRMNNERIVSQAGAFLLFGHKARLSNAGKPGIRTRHIIIKAAAKEGILKQLDQLNINRSTVFPSVEESAKHLKERLLR